MKITIKNLDPGDSSSIQTVGPEPNSRVYLHEFELRLGPEEVHDDPLEEVHRRFIQKVEDCERVLLSKYPELTTDDLEGFLLYRLIPCMWKTETGAMYFGIGSVTVRKVGTSSLEHIKGLSQEV